MRKNASPFADGSQRSLGILLDGQVVSTTQVFTVLRHEVYISGEFSRTEAEDIANLLRGGPLPCRLEPKPVRETTTGKGK